MFVCDHSRSVSNKPTMSTSMSLMSSIIRRWESRPGSSTPKCTYTRQSSPWTIAGILTAQIPPEKIL